MEPGADPAQAEVAERDMTGPTGHPGRVRPGHAGSGTFIVEADWK